MFVFGIGLFTLASLLGGLAPTEGLLLAARALQGIAAAVAAPSTLALLMMTFRDGRERARAIGLYAIALSTGAVVGQILGGALVSADIAGTSGMCSSAGKHTGTRRLRCAVRASAPA